MAQHGTEAETLVESICRSMFLKDFTVRSPPYKRESGLQKEAADVDEYNCIYDVAGDTRVSALDYFLLLDARFGGDQNAIFRPGRSSTGRRLKPLLNFERDDVYLSRVRHLALYRGEVKGWNVLSQDEAAQL